MAKDIEHLENEKDSPKGGRKPYKERRGNRVPRGGEEPCINNVPGEATDADVGVHISDLMTDIEKEVPVEESLKPAPDKLEAVKRKNTNVSVDTIQPAEEGRLYRKQREIIKLRIGGTNSQAELRNVEASLPDEVKNNPYFQRILRSQEMYLLGKEKVRRLKDNREKTAEELPKVAGVSKIEHNKNEGKINTDAEESIVKDTSIKKEPKMAETVETFKESPYKNPAFPDNPPDNPHEEIEVSDGSPTGYPDGSVEFSETKETEATKTLNEQMVEKLVENGTLINPTEMKKVSSDLIDKWVHGELTADEYRKSVEELTVNLEKMDRVKNAKGESWEFLQELNKIKDDIKTGREHFDQRTSDLEEELLKALLENIEKNSDLDRINEIGELLSENEKNIDPYYFKKLERMVSKFKDSTEQEQLREELNGTKAKSSRKGVSPEVLKEIAVDHLMRDANEVLDERKPNKAEYYDFLKRVADLKADISEEDGARLQALHNRLVELNSLEMSEAERAVLENFENVEDPKDPYTAARIQQIKKGDFSQAIVLESGETFSSIYDFLKRDLMLAESNLEDARTVDRADNEKVSPEKIKEWENIVAKITKAIELIDKLKTKASDIKDSSVPTQAEIETQIKVKELAQKMASANGETEYTPEELQLQLNYPDEVEAELKKLAEEDENNEGAYNLAYKAIKNRDKSYKVTNTWLQSVCGTDIEGTKTISRSLIEGGVLGRPDAEYGTMEILLDEKPSDVPKENLSAAMLEDMQKQNKEKGAIRKFLGKRKSEKPTDGNGEATAPESQPLPPQPGVESNPKETKEKGLFGRIFRWLGARKEPIPKK